MTDYEGFYSQNERADQEIYSKESENPVIRKLTIIAVTEKVHSPERNHVWYPFAFRSIAQCHDELQGQEKDIYQSQGQINPLSLMQMVSICDQDYKLEETTHNFSGTKSINFLVWQEVNDDAER